jgi:hypothetical protein
VSGQFDPRITAYFGDAVLQAGFMPLPNLFLRHYRKLGLSHVQAMFVLQLMEIAWDLGSPPTTIAKLADRMGVTRRAIQAWSADLHALGLVDIYDQYDAGGAQIENGYNLAPLFQRLAEYAPVHEPTGQLRTRKERGRRGAPAQPETVATPMNNRASPPVNGGSPSPMHEDSSAPRIAMHRPPESTFTEPVQPDSRLKEESKKQTKRSKEKQQEQHVAVVGDQMTILTDLSTVSNGSEPTTHEAERVHDLFRQAGINATVADAVSPTMDLAGCWTVLAYARSCELGAGWIASEIYDFKRRRPRPIDLPRNYAMAGQQLAELPDDVGARLLGIVDQHCPQARADALAVCSEVFSGQDHQWQLSFETLWAVMVEQRAKSAPPRMAAPAAPVRSDAQHSGTGDPRWLALQNELARKVSPDDFHVWLEGLVLLDISDEVVVLGAPNVFVRDHVMSTFQALIVDLLSEIIGHAMRVEFAIDTVMAA